ncbi:YlbE family protein [Obesumbacterium proteus]|uniref:DUF1116 domain-containing protein n=1 Tax=Obesumbacterium proteus TaxID=82983 RepID=UPI001F314C46|nr:DUF1116 domain-containing protein [Obesumbacterium proteus]MCE9884924.1 DUF1116 domain-containing protein [Obesumbacterium proteus]MCE9917206.1 DUF1116 domain-containing protein [Obesumbacterium proteus]MCE9928427.1 DUF1116 domain-containing protein [Obesumbacterium proteus]MCG2875568.1 DUF1116 domain-containing protein [Obesumbacterium proteus]
MYSSIAHANEAIVTRIKEARPFWTGVHLAKEVIPALREGKTLLHAGPPIEWQDMTGPMRGACLGACLYEGWAQNEQQAHALLETGEITFIPCHHVNAVGPMGGITSANMPVLEVKNHVHGNSAYCNLNEGIGKVMRFGAYGEDVQRRLCWMRDTLAPVLQQALSETENGIDLSALMAQAITMGDEFHQRNIAASALLMRTLAPKIALQNDDKARLGEVLQFLSVTDQFFLNLAMAYCKAVMDAAAEIKAGSIVTAMTRNGRDFGIRVSGLGDRWFTAPVNTPQGLFFTGFSQDDANPDIGDSAITETFGIGGAAMIAAPGVTRFVGAGGMDAAQETSEEMSEIYLQHNPLLQIPSWNFQGACLGLDIRRVVETGITPLINTGIAHREAGIGQVGAGTVRAPLPCFEQALEALAEAMNIHA